MNYEINVVPPGGGETDYTIEVPDASFVPRSGEYILVREPDPEGEGILCAFKVRYAAIYLEREDNDAGKERIALEVEPISHGYQTAGHRKVLEMYANRGHSIESYPVSGY